MKIYKITFLFFCILSFSCSKEYLDVKPKSNLQVPNTLEAFRQLLDHGDMRAHPELLEIQADDYLLEESYWNNMTNIVFKNAHVWADDIYEATESEYWSWDILYKQIFCANIVLDGLKEMDTKVVNKAEYELIKGYAYFIRAYALFTLTQIYLPAYTVETADTQPGLPVPLTSDINERLSRGTMQQTFDHILSDLSEAGKLLANPVDFSTPSKVAYHALSARVYLAMRKYQAAGGAADNSLSLYDHLQDFNLSPSRDYHHTIFLGWMGPATIINTNAANTIIHPDLYALYEEGDLRKQVYFSVHSTGRIIRRTVHGLFSYNFSGLDTDEQFLIRAECHARAGQAALAMDDLNHLLSYRYKQGSFQERTVTSAQEALDMILLERRKELVFRGLRWSDLKRLNQEGAGIRLIRELGVKQYVLESNSPKWTFPIPPNEIKRSNIEQNPR